jgi:uncharacterized membrane protein
MKYVEDEVAHQAKRRYRAILGVIIIALILILWWAMARFNSRLHDVRDAVGPLFKWLLIALAAVVLLALIVIFLINYIGKRHQSNHQEHAQPEDSS